MSRQQKAHLGNKNCGFALRGAAASYEFSTAIAHPESYFFCYRNPKFYKINRHIYFFSTPTLRRTLRGVGTHSGCIKSTLFTNQKKNTFIERPRYTTSAVRRQKMWPDNLHRTFVTAYFRAERNVGTSPSISGNTKCYYWMQCFVLLKTTILVDNFAYAFLRLSFPTLPALDYSSHQFSCIKHLQTWFCILMCVDIYTGNIVLFILLRSEALFYN